VKLSGDQFHGPEERVLEIKLALCNMSLCCSVRRRVIKRQLEGLDLLFLEQTVDICPRKGLLVWEETLPVRALF